MFENLSHINPDTMPDASSKAIVQLLLSVIENQQKQIKEFKELVQSLKDEISKLKGEQPKPEFKPQKENIDISSQNKAQKNKPHHKIGKKSFIPIDKKIICQVDREILPVDAVFKGYDTLIQQDIIFKRENTQFDVEIWYSPSLHKTFRAQTPQYQGYFGNQLKSFCIVMHKDIDVTHSKLLRIFNYLKIELSAGSLQNILSENSAMWLGEKVDILLAGLLALYTQTDTTGANVAGQLHRTHIICSQWFAVFSTLEGKSRRHLLYALQGEPQSGLMMVYTPTTLQYLEHFKISKTDISQLEMLFQHKEPISELEFKQIISSQIPELLSKPTVFNKVCDCFAFGYYHYQTQYPTVNILVSDDAPEYQLIGKEHELCWIHDGRYYNKLTPILEYNKQILSDFKERYWTFYDTLLQYAEVPNSQQKQQIEQNFDTLFIANTSYSDINKVIERTRKDKKKLLLVLEHPKIPLHNNRSELAARHQVRKRDICLHTITRMGTQLQDAFMSIIYTCNLVGINAFTYIRERIAGNNEFYLPDLVRLKINSS
jgi:hypothetical protein